MEQTGPNKKVAIVTFKGHHNIATKYEQLVVEALAELGVKASICIWDDATVEWTNFDLIMISSTWDYHHRLKEFSNWLDTLPSQRVFNPVPALKWNTDKRYLLDLQNKGIPVVATKINEKDTKAINIARSNKWPKVVVKPTVSASSENTFLWKNYDDIEAGQETIAGLEKQGHVFIIQPYLETVETEGEWDLICFNKQFSHAIHRIPKDGDFRSQEEHGGSWKYETPSAELQQLAISTLEIMEWDLLYARVDILQLETGQPVVSELEIIEPCLYVTKEAVKKLAHEIINRLKTTD